MSRQTGHGHDQYNDISAELIAARRRNLALIDERIGHHVTVYFAVTVGDATAEETMHTTLVLPAGRVGRRRPFPPRIGLGSDGRFYNTRGEQIDVVFKLYPWDMVLTEHFGEACFRDMVPSVAATRPASTPEAPSGSSRPTNCCRPMKPSSPSSGAYSITTLGLRDYSLPCP